MTDTQAILRRVSALRDALAKSNVATAAPTADQSLSQKVQSGSECDALIDCMLRQLPGDAPLVRMPQQLTARAHRLLESGKDLLQQLRILGDDFPSDIHTSHPAMRTYDQTVAMTDVALRMIGAFPESPSVQLRLCEGVEATLIAVQQKMSRLTVWLHRLHQETGWIESVAVALSALQCGAVADPHALSDVARAILSEQREGAPLRFVQANGSDAARAFAAHGVNVASVMARLIRNDQVLSRRPVEPLLAALLHDVGMLGVPEEIWTKPSPLEDSERRTVEAHCTNGAEWVRTAFPDKPWLAEAVNDHHERLDGTGYPGGRRDNQIGWLARLLSVCDVYTALRSPRPHRNELNSRTALTDTLVHADSGALDRHAAERLLTLSMYPPGTAVELNDGALGIVVAVSQGLGDFKAASRPVIALLIDAQGQAMPPHHLVDLGACEGRSVIRSLTMAERHGMLAEFDTEWM